MPWTPKQHRLFEAAAHNPQIATRVGIPQAKASQMASEGIKRPALPKPNPNSLARALLIK